MTGLDPSSEVRRKSVDSVIVTKVEGERYWVGGTTPTSCGDGTSVWKVTRDTEICFHV